MEKSNWVSSLLGHLSKLSQYLGDTDAQANLRNEHKVMTPVLPQVPRV